MRGQYTLEMTNGKIYAGLSLTILSKDVIICGGTLIVFLVKPINLSFNLFKDTCFQNYPYNKAKGFLRLCLPTSKPLWFSFTIQLLICPGKVYNYFGGENQLE